MKVNVIGLKETIFHFPVPKTDEFKIVSHSEFKKNYAHRMNEYNATVQGNVKNVFKDYASNLHPMYDALGAAGKPKIVMESAIFRQNSPSDHTKVYYRFAWNHFMRGLGEFNNANSPPDRWNRLQQEQKIEIKDWRNTGNHILIVLQKQYDSSLVGLYEKHKKYANWLKEVLLEIRKHTDRKILIRDHPRMKFNGLETAIDGIKNIERSKNNKSVNNSTAGEHLLKDFEDAWAVVGYTSSSLVDSVCEGIPTFALSEHAMAYDVCNHDLSQIETPNRSIDRQQWLNDMAYSQWNYEEIKKGEPWERIKPIYFK